MSFYKTYTIFLQSNINNVARMILYSEADFLFFYCQKSSCERKPDAIFGYHYTNSNVPISIWHFYAIHPHSGSFVVDYALGFTHGRLVSSEGCFSASSRRTGRFRELGLFFISIATLPEEQGSSRLLTPDCISSLCSYFILLIHVACSQWSREVNILPGMKGLISSPKSFCLIKLAKLDYTWV